MLQIYRIHRKGLRIGFENPAEVPYYEAIGKVNLYDLAMINSDSGDSGKENAAFQNFFNSLPMGIIEVRDDKTRFVRSNQSYRDFIKRFFGYNLSYEGSDFVPYDDSFMNNVVKTCCEQGIRSFYDEKMPNGSIIHSFARRIGVNPVDGTIAVAVAVLSITDADSESATYAGIARALAADYYNIYCVELDTERYIEYRSDVGVERLTVERHGEGFFESSRRDAMTRIYEEDRASFLKAFTKKNIIRALDRDGVFTIIYRLIESGEPMYVNMKITRMLPDRNRIIMGISIVDAQMKQQEEEARARHERVALGRIAALSGNYIVIYSVDPETNQYVEFSADADYGKYGLAKDGEDFFEQVRVNSPKAVHPEDFAEYTRLFTRENVLREIGAHGLFALNYRLVLNGRAIPVSLRAAIVREDDGEKLIVGINRVEN